MTIKVASILTLVAISTLVLSACGKKQPQFSPDSLDNGAITPLVDKDATDKINITKTFNLNQEIPVTYQTYGPDGQGTAIVKVISVKEIPTAGKKTPDPGKKLILVNIAVMGNSKNQGEPSTFNQIGDHPSPQFVMIDRVKNTSEVETTYYSDGYTQDKNLFELSKITLDHQTLVSTAIVFQVDQSYVPDLAFRFTDTSGKVEFYGINQNSK